MFQFQYKLFFLTALLSLGSANPFSQENVKEVSCENEYKPANQASTAWIKQREDVVWYYKMGNRAHARVITHVLTGQDPTGIEIFKDSCFSIRRTKNGFSQSGFKTHADFKCSGDFGAPRTCFPDHESKTTVLEWAFIRGTTEATVVWTDNSKYELGFRCSGGTTLWSLRSTDRSPVDEATKKTVLDFVESRGFHRDHAVEFPHDGCPEVAR